MTNVDIALLTGHDLRNDNIRLMRLIGTNDKAAPHPQLLTLFEHYKFLLTSDCPPKDDILYKASMAYAYSTFFKLYGERIIYREPVNLHISTNETFFKKYLLQVDPLLIALSFNSIAYLWFCTEEYSLVKRVVKRLIYLSSVWEEFLGDGAYRQSITVCTNSGDEVLESHWVKYMPSFNIMSTRDNGIDLRIYRLLPPGFNKCIIDVFTAFNLFKRDYSAYNTIPDDINWSVFVKICLNADKSIQRLIDTIKKIESVFFDPEFMFDGLKWQCTHEELKTLLRSDQRGFNNANVWLLLCYLNRRGQFIINFGNVPPQHTKHNWSTSDIILGQAMFAYCVYHNPDSIMSFLHTIQFKRNRKHFDEKIMIKLIQKYREFGLTLDPKKLGIKRGVLINLLSAGFGDIFCVS